MSGNQNGSAINRQVPVETYKCSQCNFYTNHEYYLQQHSLTHSLQILMEQYKRSQFNYDSNNQVQAYIKPHNLSHGTQVPNKTYRCMQCNFETNIENYYEQHILTHNTPTVDPYRVQTPRSFENEEDLYIKQNLNHITEPFGNNEFIREHDDLKLRDLTHNTPGFDGMVLKEPDLDTTTLELFKCSLANCSFETIDESDFKQHTLTHGVLAPEVYKCNKCDIQLLQEKDFKQHIKEHPQDSVVKLEENTPEVFRCHNCDYETNLKAFLKRHIIANHGTNVPIKKENLGKYKCAQCNFETQHEKFLRRHEVSHKEKQYYTCKTCSFQTLYKKMYVRHVKTHKIKKKVKTSVAESVKCDECNFEVGSKEQLDIHKKLRHTEKEIDSNLLKCSYCKYQTNWEPCLKRHIDRLHADENTGKNKRKTEKEKGKGVKKKNESEKKDDKQLFRCDNCEFCSASKQYLILHLKRSHSRPLQRSHPLEEIPIRSNLKQYKCKFKSCPFLSSQKSQYVQHIIGHHKRGVLFFCDLCTFVTKKEENLQRHKIKEHLSRFRQVYKCSQCNFKTISKNNFKAHSSKHKKFTCNVCEQEVESAYALVKHRRIHQENPKNRIYLCDVCGFQSKNDRSLKMHTKTHNPEFKCPDCPFETHSKVNFQNHCINHKSADEVTMFPCPHCSYQSRLKRNLAWHMKRHVDPSKAKIFKCPGCDYQTFTNAQLKSHLMVHKSKEEVMMLKCDFCAFETKRRSNMVQHRLRHMKDSPDVPLLSCPDCNYTTVAKRHLNKHRRTHTVNPDKMFQCSYCPFKIHRKVYLMRHMENHKNVDPMSGEQWQRFPYPPQANMGVTIVPNLGQNIQHNMGPSLM